SRQRQDSPAPTTTTPRSSRPACTAPHSYPPGSALSVGSRPPFSPAPPGRPGGRPPRPSDRCTAAWTHRPPGSRCPRPPPTIRRRPVKNHRQRLESGPPSSPATGGALAVAASGQDRADDPQDREDEADEAEDPVALTE